MQRVVLIVNPDPAERNRLSGLLTADPNCRVIALPDCESVFSDEELRWTAPDVVLVEPLALAEPGAASRIAEIRRRWTESRIVAFVDPVTPSVAVPGVEEMPRPESLLRIRSLVASRSRPKTSARTASFRTGGFDGYLEGIPLGDLVQILCMTRRTGLLRLQTEGGSAVVALLEGEVVHAEDPEGVGETAFYRILRWAGGCFSFDDGAAARRRTIRMGWEHLLIEGMRLRDETGSTACAAEAPGALETMPDGSPADLADRYVGPYQIIRRGVRRRDGVLYEAMNTVKREHLHLFVLDPSRARDPMRMRRFLDRGKRLAEVEAENLVRTLGVGEAHGLVYCVEEHVEGTTLAERIAGGRPIDAGQALEIFRSCLRGLIRLRAAGLRHEGLDPSAILLGLDGVPRLTSLNGLMDDGAAGAEEVAALAVSLRKAIRPEDRGGEVDRFLERLEKGAAKESLEDLLRAEPGTRPPSAAAASGRKRRDWFRFARGLPWAAIWAGLLGGIRGG